MAQSVAETDAPVIVSGDLNDVAYAKDKAADQDVSKNDVPQPEKP